MGTRIAAQMRLLTVATLLTAWAVAAPSVVRAQAAGINKSAAASAPRAMAPLAWLAGQTGTLLGDGQWLMVGGTESSGQATRQAWLVRADGVRVPLGSSLSRARAGHSATVLSDGRVLILGGTAADGAVSADADLYDPATQQFSARALPVLLARAQHSANLLSDGRVLIAGGTDSKGRSLDAAELWNPVSGEVARFNGRMTGSRFGHRSALLPDGNLLIWEGQRQDRRAAEEAEVFSVGTQSFARVTSTQAQAAIAALDGSQPPVLSWSRPAAEARNVSGADPLVLRFNKRVVPASLTSRSITLVGPNGAESVTVAAAEGGLLAFVRPAKELLPASRYTLFLNGVTDAGNRAVPLTAIGFDTAAVGGAAPGSSLVEASTGASSGPTRGPAAPAIDPRALAAMQDDDELFVPDARHRRGDWFSRKADRALQVMPKQAALRQAMYGQRDWEEGRLDRRASALGVSRRAASLNSDERAASERDRARLTWADIDEYARAQKEAVKSTGSSPAATGATALAGQVLRLNGRPLANVTLSINGISARTDDQGEFLLSGIPAGSQILHIDGRSANRRDATYGVFEYRLDLQAGQTNALPFVVWMPKLDTRHAVKIDSPTKTDVKLTHPLLPGFEVTLPAGTVIRDTDGKIVTEVSITPLPVDQTPFPMPYLGVPLYYTIQPGGAVIQGIDGKPRAATVRYPNYTNFGPGAPMRLFDYDAKGRGWYVYAQARVSADGSTIESDRTFQIYQFGATSASSGGPNGGGGGGDGCGGGGSGGGGGGGGWSKTDGAGAGACGGDPVDLTTGHFSHVERDLYIPDVIPIDVRRTYRTLDNAGSTTQYVRSFGVGTTHPYEIYLYLPAPSYSAINLVMPNGRVVYFPSELGTVCCYVSKPFRSVETAGEFHGAYIQYSSNDAALVLYFRDGRRWAFPTYNARLKWMEDSNGNRLNIERASTASYASRVVSPSGRYVNFSYNAQGLISQITDNVGRSFNYTYDGYGRLTEVTDPNGQKRNYTWDATANRILTIKDPNANTVVSNEFDAQGRVSKQTLADNSTFQYAYTTDATGKILQTDVTDRRGTVRRVQLNGFGLVQSNTYAVGLPEQQVTTYSISNGLTLNVTDALNRRTEYEYDSKGFPTKMTRLAGTAGAVNVSMTWDTTLGRLLSYTDANNLTTTLEYDPKGNLTKVTNPLSQSVTLTYDGQGKPVTIKDALNRQTTLSYSGPDLASITDALNRQMQYFTDSAGRQLAQTDPLGNRTFQEWDSLNRLSKLTNALGQTVQFNYDANGNVTSQIDERGNSTAFSYNALSLPAGMTDALQQSESQLYESGGRVRQRIDRKGQLSAVSYDALGRAKRIGFGASAAAPTAFKSVIELTWDAGNRLTQILDKTCANPSTSLNCSSAASSRTITREYDLLDRLTREVTPQGEVAYTYDAGGRRLSMTLKNGAPGSQTTQPTISYSWDNANRLTGISQAAGAANGNVAQSIVLAYDAVGRRTRTTLSNGSTIDYGYDNADQLTSLTYKRANGTLIGDITYTYDAAGRRTGMGGTLARLSLPAADVSDAAYDANNRLTQWAGKTFSYDANGNLLADGTHSYQWDERNQLAGLSAGATQLGSFSYDSLGRRSSKTIAGATTGFVYDGNNFVQELLGSSNTSAVKAQLITGGIDETFLRMEGANLHSFLADGNNNTVRLLDSAQAKVVDYTYEPYGSTSADATNGNTQQYTGRENDNPGNANGLYYYRARYYMPGCARFISEDPIGWASGQTNNYAYVAGDPVNYTDPYGLCGWSDAIVGFGDAFGAGLIREALGISNGTVDTSGTWYGAGFWGGVVWGSVSTGLQGAAAIGGTKIGHILNHNRHIRVGPGRWGKDMVPRASSQHPPFRNPFNPDGHVNLSSRIGAAPPVGVATGGGGGGNGSGHPCD